MNKRTFSINRYTNIQNKAQKTTDNWQNQNTISCAKIIRLWMRMAYTEA